MAADLKPVQNYIDAIEKKLAMDDVTKYIHRTATEMLAEDVANY